MFRKPLVFVAVIVGLCAGVRAERPAGIVLYFKSGGEIFLLLADHRESDRGWAIGQVHSEPEDRLYDLLSRSSDLAHARYGAYLRQATSFADACYVARIDRRESAR